MALIVEDGSIVAGADSYISVADADLYHAAHENPAAWTAASVPDKERALRVATQWLDATYLTSWLGARVDADQALAWPRTGVWDFDGYGIDDDQIPKALKDAECELAVRYIVDGSLFTDEDFGTNITSESVSIGPLSKSTSYSGTKGAAQKRYTIVSLLLRALTFGGGGGASTRIWRG